MSEVIVLIGAGASFDAGLPLVGELTTELRERLPALEDVNGKPRSEFAALFDAIAQHDREVPRNYERFFEWLALMRQGQMTPFRSLVRFDLTQDLLASPGVV